MHPYFHQENSNFEQANFKKCNNFDQSVNEPRLYKRTILTCRTNLDVEKLKIQHMSNSITQLLSVIKQPKPKAFQAEPFQNQLGFQDYRRRILQLQKLQENFQKEEELRIKRAASIIELQAQRKKISQDSILQNQYHKISLDDRLPISRPSVVVTHTQRTTSKSPKFLLKPTSKYIREKTPPKFSKFCPQNQPNVKKNGVGSTNLQPRFTQYISFNQLNRRQTPQKKNQIFYKNQKLENESSIQSYRKEYQKQKESKPEKQQKQEVQEKEANIEQKHKEEKHNEEKKEQEEQQTDQNKKNAQQKQKDEVDLQNINAQTLPETAVKKIMTFHEMDERMKTPIDILEQNNNEQVNQSIQLKVYPCDLNKDTVKVFIANHFASVVNLDIQFMNMKQQFLYQQFKQKLNLSQKRFHLLKVLWERGLFVDEKNLDNLIDFQIQPDKQSSAVNQNQNFFDFLEAFVNKYLQAQNQWQKKIVHMLTRIEIESTGFKPGFLDLENRGFLKAQDISCFINLYATNSPYYKNKQVKELFWRFCRYESEPQKLSYEGFMHIIARRV